MGDRFSEFWNGERLVVDPPDDISSSELSVDYHIAEPSPVTPDTYPFEGNTVDPQADESHSLHPPTTPLASYPSSIAQEEAHGFRSTRDSLPSSTMDSGLANPPSESRNYFPLSNPSVTVTPPTYHMGVTNATILNNYYGQSQFCNGDQDLLAASLGDGPAHQRMGLHLKCPYIGYLSNLPQNYPNQATLVSTVRALDHLVTDENLAQYYQWKESNTLQSRPPSVNSSNSSGTPNREAYLCRGWGDQQCSTSSQKFSSKYGCPTCGRGFEKRDDLRKHLQAQNPPVQYRCPTCNGLKAFKRKDKYRDHLRRKHPNSPCDNDYLTRTAVHITQSFPETCLHCPRTLQSFREWFEHWCSEHEADPNTPRRTSIPRPAFNSGVSPRPDRGHPLDRFMVPDQFEVFRTGMAQSTTPREYLVQQQMNELTRVVQQN